MHQQKILKDLVKFGFTLPQARLYLAGLMWGHGLMAQLARTAGVRRSTAYYLMQELLRRGFFQRKKIGKRHYYFAATPKRLLAMTRERERLVKKIIPHLTKVRPLP